VDTIPNHHRHGANFIFAMVLRMLGWDLAEDNGFSQAERERYEKRFGEPAFWRPSLSLFGLPYAFDAFEKEQRHWDIPERITEYKYEKEYENRTQRSAINLKKWCKCIMDPVSEEERADNRIIQQQSNVRFAKFTHRSIPEFLMLELRRRSRDLRFDEDNVAEGILAIAQALNLPMWR
jgi:hypothetical protein